MKENTKFLNLNDLELLWQLSITDFKLKYKNTLLGYFWSVVNPILLMVSMYIVFSYAINMNIPHFQFFLLIGIICWNYFSGITTGSLLHIANNTNLFKKHKVKPELFILSSCISGFANLFINILVFIIMIFIFNLQVTYLSIISVFYIVLLFIFSVGISFVLTSIYTVTKDIVHIWSFLLMIGFWLSPIFYSEMMLPENIRVIYMLNPIARIISHLRNILLNNFMDSFQQIIITVLLTFIVLLLGFWLFKLSSSDLSEKI